MTPSITILIAEDEPLILVSTGDVLQAGGFNVLTAQNGDEAIGLLDTRTGEIAGLITDVKLGAGPSGWEVAKHGRSLNGDLPVVYITGDSAADWSTEGVPKSIVVQKPYADAQLLTAISTLLNIGH